MKPVVLVVFAISLAGLAAAGGQDWPGFPRKRSLQRRATTANINDYLDRVLAQAAEFLVENNYEPYPLVDKYALNFTITDLVGLHWKTRLGLYDGLAQNLSTIHRSGDAQLVYASDARSLEVQATVAFDRVAILYHYAAQLLNVGPKGSFTATVKNLTASIDISVNLRSFNATLHSFTINSAKSIKVDVKGLTFLGNWVVEAFANVFTTILKGPILKVVQGVVRGALQAGVDSVNAGPIFGSGSGSS